MIDYDKLNFANELIDEINYLTKDEMELSFCFHLNKPESAQDMKGCANDKEYLFFSIDDVINKLTKLLSSYKPKPKYEVGRQLWFLNVCINCTPIDGLVDAIDDKSYLLCGRWFKEDELYETREALIESQIDYWQSLKTTDNLVTQQKNCRHGPYEDSCSYCKSNVCKHENDGHFYPFTESGALGNNNKCKKCGEFYR